MIEIIGILAIACVAWGAVVFFKQDEVSNATILCIALFILARLITSSINEE